MRDRAGRLADVLRNVLLRAARAERARLAVVAGDPAVVAVVRVVGRCGQGAARAGLRRCRARQRNERKQRECDRREHRPTLTHRGRQESKSFGKRWASWSAGSPDLRGFEEGERRDSNPRHPGPQPGALPAELRPPSGRRKAARGRGRQAARNAAASGPSGVSTPSLRVALASSISTVRGVRKSAWAMSRGCGPRPRA